MNILINCLLLNQHNTGVQNTIENSLCSLDSMLEKNINVEVLISKKYSGKLNETINLKIKKQSFDSQNRFLRIGWEQFALPLKLILQEPDIFHGPGYLLPHLCHVPSIITIHDLLTLQHPEWCQDESVFYFKWSLPRSIKKATKIIAVSEKVKEEILKEFNVAPEKISVIYHGVSSEFEKIIDKFKLNSIRQKYKLPDKFILYIGNLEPKKNLVRLIKAFEEVKLNSDLPHHLVLAGKNGWKSEQIHSAFNNSSFRTSIHLTGYIDQSDLAALYSLSDLFVFPSLYEGFGLPVIESMSCGIPVVTSNIGALPEITNGACPLIDPYNIRQIRDAIIRLLTDITVRQDHIHRGLVRAKFFSWEKNARELLEVYHSTLTK